MRSDRARARARSNAFSNSRTFPGQVYRNSKLAASGEKSRCSRAESLCGSCEELPGNRQNVVARLRNDRTTSRFSSNVVNAVCREDGEAYSSEAERLQPANNFLAIHRASRARCGPSISDPATAPSNSTTSARAIAFASFTPAAAVHSKKRFVNHSR
jgi:hypothetical protein